MKKNESKITVTSPLSYVSQKTSYEIGIDETIPAQSTDLQTIIARSLIGIDIEGGQSSYHSDYMDDVNPDDYIPLIQDFTEIPHVTPPHATPPQPNFPPRSHTNVESASAEGKEVQDAEASEAKQ